MKLTDVSKVDSWLTSVNVSNVVCAVLTWILNLGPDSQMILRQILRHILW